MGSINISFFYILVVFLYGSKHTPTHTHAHIHKVASMTAKQIEKGGAYIIENTDKCEEPEEYPRLESAARVAHKASSVVRRVDTRTSMRINFSGITDIFNT